MKALDEDEEMLRNMQRDATYTNANLRDAMLASSTGQAMRDAANNANGAMAGFMGMNMAGQFGMNTMNNYQQAQYQQMPPQGYQQMPPQGYQQMPPQGYQQQAPMQPQQTVAVAGAAAGAPQDGWTCTKCGTVNQGKFCANCGEKKPEGAPQYKCDKCGWVPPDPSNPPKFCPECGDPFGDEDKV